MTSGKIIKFFLIIFFIFINHSYSDNHDIPLELDRQNPDDGFTFADAPNSAAAKYISSLGFKVGANERPDGSIVFFSAGEGSSSVDNDSPTIHDARYAAYNRAVLKAKEEYVKFLGVRVRTSMSNIIKENTMNNLPPEQIIEKAVNQSIKPDEPGITDKFVKLLNLKLDKELKKEGYDPNAPKEKKQEILKKVVQSNRWKKITEMSGQTTMSGFQILTTFEQKNAGDRPFFTVVGLWSPKLNQLAKAIKSKNFTSLPKGTPAKPVADQIPKKASELIGSFGAKMYVNENGQRVILSYGIGTPLKENRRDLLNNACSQAYTRAVEQIAYFVNESVLYEEKFGEEDVSEDSIKDGNEQYLGVQGRDWYKKVASSAELDPTSFETIILNKGTERESDSAVIPPNPTFNRSACIKVVMWSPSGQTMSNSAKNQMQQNSGSSNSGGSSNKSFAPRQGAAGSRDF